MGAAPTFAQRCGVHDAARQADCERVLRLVSGAGVERVRIMWCDAHGATRGKTVTARALAGALDQGIGMVSTLMLKDTSDRTAFKVFEPGALAGLAGFGQANNLVLLPDPGSYQQLPWAPGTGWLRAQPWFQDATPVPLDTRRVLEAALARLAARGLGLRCGLEVEFHVYRIEDATAALDPQLAAWPGDVPRLSMVHPGYNLLAESWADRADAPLAIVQQVCDGLGLPLTSLEIELGPSQVEAVFEATDALTAADHMVQFRSGVRQALARAGYHASFICRPPFPNVMASGWHLHQSLVDLGTGRNAFMRDAPAADASPAQAESLLTPLGARYLAGLLAHARAMAIFCTPTANGYGRFAPNAMAPTAVCWGRDNRGAMLRVIGAPGDRATRIENRIGEPSANPYLYFAAQVHAGLDGVERELGAPPATGSPYAAGAPGLPTDLGAALAALHENGVLVQAFGPDFIQYYSRLKESEWARFSQASDKAEFMRREYFGRL